MKGYLFKTVLSLSFVLSVVVPNQLSGMAIDTGNKYIPQTPAAYVGTKEVKSTEAVYIANRDCDPPGSETKNFNSGSEGKVLVVSTGSEEFACTKWTLVRFYPITLPSDASITGAKIRLYQQSSTGLPIKTFSLLEPGFSEGGVTWNTKPPMGDLQSTTNVPVGSGWREFNISASLVRSWVRSPNTNLGLALVPGTTQIGYSALFASDEVAGYEPRLVITYTTSEGVPPPPPPPPPPPEDTTPCTISCTLNPDPPQRGQPLTITCTARDNKAMSYLAIYKGSTRLVYREATQENQTTLTATYTASGNEVDIPGIGFIIQADDQSPAAAAQSLQVYRQIAGTGTRPRISVTIRTDIETIPETHRLIKGGGERVHATVTVTDPDGLDRVEVQVPGRSPVVETPGGGTARTMTVNWTNSDPRITEFYVQVYATDRENNRSSHRETVHITQPYETFPARYALGIGNPETPEISWDRMKEVFGADECSWSEATLGIVQFDNPWASLLYDNLFKTIAAKGHCFGISTTALEFYHRRISSDTLQNYRYPISYDQAYTWQYVQDRQGAQCSAEIAIPSIQQYLQYIPGRSHLEKLAQIENDLRNDNSGIISIFKGIGGSVYNIRGHAIVPWMVRHLPDGTTRVYVYDCNREGAKNNPDADFANFDHFPYIIMDSSSWGFRMGNEIWSEMMLYNSYENALGDASQERYISPPIHNVTVTDHDLPSDVRYVVDILWCLVGGGADVYVEDSEGNITGIYQGRLRTDIPGSAPLIIAMAAGTFPDHEVYALPNNRDLTIHVVGNEQGSYNLALMDGRSLYAVRQKAISQGVEDIMRIARFEGAVGNRMELILGEADDDFEVDIGHRFAPRPGTAIKRESIDRVWILDNISADEGGELGVYVEEGGDSLIVENTGEGDIEFDVTARSTESLESFEQGQEPSYMPESTEENITIEPGRGVTLTPENWATTEERGRLHTLGHKAGKRGALPIIPVIIGAVAIAAIAAVTIVLLKRGTFKKVPKTHKTG